jgi:hypothetical protein
MASKFKTIASRYGEKGVSILSIQGSGSKLIGCAQNPEHHPGVSILSIQGSGSKFMVFTAM